MPSKQIRVKVARIRKKAQTATEFFMSSSWALVIAVLVVGLLVVFSLLRTQQSLPEHCDITTSFGCVDHEVYPDGIVLVIQNREGDHLKINQVSVENCGEVIKGSKYGNYLPQGEKDTYKIIAHSAPYQEGNGYACQLEPGSKEKFNIVINYETERGLEKRRTGTLESGVIETPGASKEKCKTIEEDDLCTESGFIWPGFNTSCCKNYNYCC